MSTLKTFYNKIIENKLFYFTYVPFVSAISLLGFTLLCYPAASVEGVKEGIGICTNVLIPSLFPFLLISHLFVESGALYFRNKIVSWFMRVFFALPGSAFPIILLSFIGGFPVGAILIKNAYEKGVINESEGQRMLLFCVNPGPAFTFITVGYTLYGSKKTGVIIYAVTVLSGLLLGILSRFFDDNKINSELLSMKKEHKSLSDSVNTAVNLSVRGILNICVWVIIFSCLKFLLGVFPLGENTYDFICMISEVVNGTYSASQKAGLPAVCAVIGFSGLCIHFQVLPSIIKLKLKYRFFLVSRIISAAFNCIICYIFVDLVPYSVETAALGIKPEKATVMSSAPVCICLMLLCGLFIVKDYFLSERKEKNISIRQGNKTQLY